MIVYMPLSFPADFQQRVKEKGATVRPVAEPLALFEGVFSTGCSHPGVVEIARREGRADDKVIADFLSRS